MQHWLNEIEISIMEQQSDIKIHDGKTNTILNTENNELALPIIGCIKIYMKGTNLNLN